jgi:hypothetical protein
MPPRLCASVVDGLVPAPRQQSASQLRLTNGKKMKGTVLGLWACGLVSIGSAYGEVTGTVDVDAIEGAAMVVQSSDPQILDGLGNRHQPPIMLLVSPELRAAVDEAQGLRPRRDDGRGAGPLIEVDIGPQSMGDALIEWAEQTDLNLIADDMVDRLKLTHSVKGRMTAVESLELLLNGSGLQYEFATPRVVIVKEGNRNRFEPPVLHKED